MILLLGQMHICVHLDENVASYHAKCFLELIKNTTISLLKTIAILVRFYSIISFE
jgi:hypothetical protein